MRKQYKNLDYLAKLVWATPDIPTKRKLVDQMVDEFQFKGKQRYFRQQIARMNTSLAFDYLAANLALLSDCESCSHRSMYPREI